MAPAPGVTRQLVDFALRTSGSDLDGRTRDAVRRSILDSVGVSVAGSRHEAVEILLRSLPHASEGEAALVGREHRTDVVTATLANGVMAHVLDWDDTILPTRLHPSCTLVPALLAVGERTAATIADLVPAFAVGFELQQRLALAAYPEYAERGWHGTGVFGGIGVAAAVGNLLGLDADRISHAVSIAATGAAGVTGVFGSMAKALNLGRAGATGVSSALLAAEGFTGTPDLLDTDRGWLRLYTSDARSHDVVSGLGDRWAVNENGFKPYPCGVVAHAAIDGVLDLRERVAGREPAQLTVTVSPEAMRLMGNMEPETGLEAKFSVRFAAAMAWVDGRVGPDAFADASVQRRDIQEAMSLVTVIGSPEVAQEAANVVFRGSGWREELVVPHARGTISRPMTDAELRDKFDVAFAFAGNPHAERAAALVDDATPVAELMELLRA
jgi:2-methylcitrate dehydratase PrpD